MSKIRHQPFAPTRLQQLRAGEVINAHRHDEHQLVYAARGVLAITTDAGAWVAPATRAIWVPAGTVHAHQAHGELELRLIGLARAHNPLGLDKPTVLSVAPLFRELILEYTRPPLEDTAARIRLRAVLLDRLSASSQVPMHVPAPTSSRLRAVCDILREDPSDGRTLAALGRQVGASDRTLSRLFRSELRMSFPQWRTQLRLHHALLLLAQDEPVTSVANRCGWASASAFIDVFVRTFGHTPGTVRPSSASRPKTAQRRTLQHTPSSETTAMPGGARST